MGLTRPNDRNQLGDPAQAGFKIHSLEYAGSARNKPVRAAGAPGRGLTPETRKPVSIMNQPVSLNQLCPISYQPYATVPRIQSIEPWRPSMGTRGIIHARLLQSVKNIDIHSFHPVPSSTCFFNLSSFFNQLNQLPGVVIFGTVIAFHFNRLARPSVAASQEFGLLPSCHETHSLVQPSLLTSESTGFDGRARARPDNGLGFKARFGREDVKQLDFMLSSPAESL